MRGITSRTLSVFDALIISEDGFINGSRRRLRCLKVAVGALQLQPHLVKVCNNFVEQPQTLDSLVVHLGLGVEVGEARDGREHHAHGVVGLRVELLWGEEVTL